MIAVFFFSSSSVGLAFLCFISREHTIHDKMDHFNALYVDLDNSVRQTRKCVRKLCIFKDHNFYVISL